MAISGPYLPITCPSCLRRQGEFHSQTGFLRLAAESHAKIFGAVFQCRCGRNLRWNGEVAVKKLRKKRLQIKVVKINIAKP